ncbi:rod shape-determining protein MreD [Bacillus sp. BRMEA1]|uniref:rod shape-determining protein MreD n=1 Tax=Neobacillus endophyticus TaxID=2738405 RepID=UPI0015679146|nr:rod shape-determining protein MreD [Neobacillus endophyticus]NRD75991.1 rod shape-determining protein MreD [Neobacillus endophyticus]
MKKFLLPLLFVFLFLLESLFVQYLPDQVFGHNWMLSPHFLFIAMVLLTIFVGKKQGLLYAAIFGLLFDMVYVEILGIYLFLFPFICYLVSKIMNILHTNLLIIFLVTISAVALLEIGAYEMEHLIHVANIDFTSFLHLRFYPTILLNAAFILIVGYPLKRYFEKYAAVLNGE